MNLHEIFTPGSIVRVNHYEFEDDGSQRDKYMVVVMVTIDSVIVHSLTTSKNKLRLAASHYGCKVESNIPFFFFPSKHIIGEGDFYFELDTFLFFNNNVRETAISTFEGKNYIFDFAKVGQLSIEKHKQLIKCMLKSKNIPIRLKDLIERFKDSF